VDLSDLTPLAGGWSGQTFLAEVGGERSVVRLYHPGGRSDSAPEVDAAVLRLVRGIVPVPDVLEVRRGVAAADQPGLLVTSYVVGERGDLVLPTLDDAGVRALGGRLGSLAADLAGMPLLQAGVFVDADLRIEPFPGPDSLLGFVDEHAAKLAWDGTLLGRLREVAGDAQDLLDAVSRTCLVHSDLNPKNLLVDARSLDLTAVLDWEFAHAGHPFTDLGNLLRFDRHPSYVDAIVTRWCERRGGTAAEALELARAADLWALVDLAARHGHHPVADRAHEHLVAIARTGDLHALP